MNKGYMKDFWKFIKSSGIFFVGTVMTKLISFLLLPLYTSYISPDDYGAYDLGLTYIMFFCSVLYFDIWSGIMRFMYDYTGNERKKPISSGIGIFLCSTLMYTITMLVIAPHLNLQYPFLLGLYGVLMNCQTLAGYIARGYEKNVLYTAAGIVGSFVTILFNILLLVGLKMDYSALIIASCVGFLVNILIIVIGLKEPHVFSLRSFDFQIFKDMFVFSLPLCVNSVAYWFLTSYNRVVIDAELGAAVNGFYAIAGRFGSMITLFTTCFQMAWQELSFSKTARNDNLEEFYSVAINNFIKCMGAGLAILIPVIYIIYPFMVNESYGVGKELIPLYLFGTILSTISSFLGNAFTAIKKNNLLFWTMVIGSVSNVVCIHLLIGVVGMQASNISLAVGFFMSCLARVLIFGKHVKLDLDYKGIAILLGTIVLVSIAYHSELLWANALALCFAMLVFVFLFRDLLKQIFAGLKTIKNRKC